MSELLTKLAEKRATLWEAAKGHLDTTDPDAFTGEAEATWQRMNDELTALDKRIEEVSEAERRAKVADDAAAEFRNAKPAGQADPGTQRTDADILREIVSGERRGHEFTAESERRDLTKGTATDGQELVPTSFRAQLYEHLVQTTGMRRAGATVLTTESGETIQIPKTTSYSTASIVAEAGPISESDPQFAQVSLDAKKYAFIVDVSSELLTDSAVDITSFLARQGGRALGLGAGAHYVTGNGTTQPNGVAALASVGKTGAASVAGAFNGDDLIDLYYSVIEPYRVNATWMMRDASLAAARKLKDTNTGQYLWQPGLQAGEPGSLLGRPVVADQNVAAVALSARSILFGDFSTYYIRDVSGVRVERSDHARWDNDLASFRFILRSDGDLVDTTGAIKAFVGNAA